MSMGRQKIEVLHILSQNLANPEPQLVSSDEIARRLRISLRETELLLKVMNDQGVIESSVDQRLTLITRKGVECLRQECVSFS